ncbi:hypothetical protein ACU686_07445 [Yinghuangia aomiensis]
MTAGSGSSTTTTGDSLPKTGPLDDALSMGSSAAPSVRWASARCSSPPARSANSRNAAA